LAPSPLLFVEFFLLEQHKSIRGQGGGVSSATVMPDGSQAVGRLLLAVGSGDEDGRCQGQQNNESVMKCRKN